MVETEESSAPLDTCGGASSPTLIPSFEPSESVMLAKDVVLLRGMALSLQQELCDVLQSCPNFFACNNEKTKNIDMLHLGLHDVRGKQRLVAPIPQLYARLAVLAHGFATKRHGVFRSLPLIRADVAVVNAYKRGARLGLHVDRRSTKHPGIPVVAISLGESAEFVFKPSWKAKAAENRIILRSGDVLVFGGKARGIVHGMDRLIAETVPTDLRLGDQAEWRRLCITLRQS